MWILVRFPAFSCGTLNTEIWFTILGQYHIQDNYNYILYLVRLPNLVLGRRPASAVKVFFAMDFESSDPP